MNKKKRLVDWVGLVGLREKGGRTSKHKTNPSKYSPPYPHNTHPRDRDSVNNFLRGLWYSRQN